MCNKKPPRGKHPQRRRPPRSTRSRKTGPGRPGPKPRPDQADGEPPPLSYEEILFLSQLVEINLVIIERMSRTTHSAFVDDVKRLTDLLSHLKELRLQAFRRENRGEE